MPGSVPWLGCKGQGHVRQEGRQEGDGHHLSRVDGRESRWLCVKSGPGRSGMQGPSRRPGVKDSVAPMVGGAGAAELWVPGGFLTGGGHQGRCRAILRPGAGSRVDPARWAASPSRFLPHPEGRACHFSPRPSWPPPCPGCSPAFPSLLLCPLPTLGRGQQVPPARELWAGVGVGTGESQGMT